MKKHAWLSILIGFVLLLGCSFSAYAEEPLPDAIRDKLSGAKITHSAFWNGPDSTWFILIRTPEEKNLLLCFEQQDSKWVQSFQTSAAVPQGNVGVEALVITDKVRDFVYNRTLQGPILVILTDDGGHTSYQRSESGQWNLITVFFFDEQIHLDFDEESVTYRTLIDQDHDQFETVYGSFERDLEKVDINTIPRSPHQAKEALHHAQAQSDNKNEP